MGARLRAVSAAPPVALADVHIGIEKTGSSAIQAFLQTNRAALLADHGVLFPRSLGGRLSANLAAACQENDRPDDLRKVRGLLSVDSVRAYREDLENRLRAEIGRTQPRRLVISCEHLSSRLPRREDIERLYAFLDALAVDIRIWVYLRRQDAFQLSLYSTAVCSGRCRPFHWPEPGRERTELRYDRLLVKWARVFGEGAVNARLFEKHRLAGGDIVSDFCAALELPGDLQRPQTVVNASLNLRQLECLRALNERLPRFTGDEPNPLRGDLARAMASLPLQGEPLVADARASVYLARFSEGNREVARRWFGDDPSVPAELFEAPPPAAPSRASAPAVDHDDLLDACSHLWSHGQRQLQEQRRLNALLRAELAVERGQANRARQILVPLCDAQPDDPRARHLLERAERDARTRDSHGDSTTPPARPSSTEGGTADRRAG